MTDTIRIDELLLTLPFTGDDGDVSEEAVLLSLSIPHDISRAARSDDLAYSINYAAVYKSLVKTLPETCFASIEAVADTVFQTLFDLHAEVNEASVVVVLRTPGFSVEAACKREQLASTALHRFTISGLGFSAIIGVNPQERIEKQPVLVDITIDRRRRRGASGERFPFVHLATSIHQTFAASTYLTVEALASAIACHVLEHIHDPSDRVTIELSKPNALSLATAAQIQIVRQRNDFPDVFSGPMLTPTRHKAEANSGASSSSHSVALAVGSNLGDRFANIETALRLLEMPTTLLHDLPDDAKVAVVDTSFMYETAPMYVVNQPLFANCACMIETNLSPKELLRLVKEVETIVGRVPGVRFGPRAVDVDILTYDDQRVDTRVPDNRASLDNLIGELVIPHPRMCEREFVLRPLNDMIPQFIHPACNKTIRALLDELVSHQTENDFPMLKVIPFPRYPLDSTEVTKINGIHVPPTAKHWTVSSTVTGNHACKTYLMATLNVTPDSFSDGSQYNTVPTAIGYTTTAVASGADIIDIGGYSTRPGADVISPEDELQRVIPVIQAIRTHTSDTVRNALLSIDTFRWDVAQHAVRAGANCINDVHAFTGPTYPPDAASGQHLVQMRSVARDLCVPVVLMHSRGDAGANKDYGAYAGGLVSAVQTELGRKVDAIVRGPGGVRRWFVLVDPGIGFSKPVGPQLALMRDLGRVTAEEGGNALAGYPMLVGVSRKSVLGAVLEEPDVEGAWKGRKTTPRERVWATAAAVACAVQQGARVVRVHDVAEMRDVVAIASAIWSQ